ncbi:hypothetical protein C4564_04715 [Candidatus Microgenomates bacterium]|nr:MAG: hypothetical protein C4564_04715 [Candidatus Microgenomates bacterium]
MKLKLLLKPFLYFFPLFVFLFVPGFVDAQSFDVYFCQWGQHPETGVTGCYVHDKDCPDNYKENCSQFQSLAECNNNQQGAGNDCEVEDIVIPEDPDLPPPVGPDPEDPEAPTVCAINKCNTNEDCGDEYNTGLCEGAGEELCSGVCACAIGKCNRNLDCIGHAPTCVDTIEGQWCSGSCFQSDEDLNPYAFNGFCNNPKTGGIYKYGIDSAIGCFPFVSAEEVNSFLYVRGASIGAGIAFLMMIFSGYQMMTSKGIPEKYASAKELFTAAVTGLILILLSAFLMRAITVNFLGLFS